MAENASKAVEALTPKRIALLALIGAWLLFQILFPLRHLLYPGNVNWTEEGHRFSWQMKLRDKQGEAHFTVRDPKTGETWDVDPEFYLMRHQMVMAKRPDMLLQFAHYLEQVWQEDFGIDDVEVRVRSCVSLNGRPAALMIDPERDLTQIPRSLRPADWVLPLSVPFERPDNRKRREDLRC